MMNDMFYQTNTRSFCPYRALAPTPSYQTQGVAIGLRAPLPLWGVLDAAAPSYQTQGVAVGPRAPLPLRGILDAAAPSYQNQATKGYGIIFRKEDEV